VVMTPTPLRSRSVPNGFPVFAAVVKIKFCRTHEHFYCAFNELAKPKLVNVPRVFSLRSSTLKLSLRSSTTKLQTRRPARHVFFSTLSDHDFGIGILLKSLLGVAVTQLVHDPARSS
jgi:hypothetical protein